MGERTALVTAGAAGIGRAIADRLAADGLTVIVTDVCERAVQDARSAGLHAYVADASDYAGVAALAQTVEEVARPLDVLVNNAGIAGPTARVEDTVVEAWNRPCLSISTRSSTMCKSFLPLT